MKSHLIAIDTVTSFIDYVQEIEKFHPNPEKYLLFRGQSKDYPLLPSVARDAPGVNSKKREMHMLDELRRRGGFIANIDRMTNWELMVYAQHHEMKTRLLDWTSNPLMALWFACENEYLMNDDSFVFVLRAPDNSVIDSKSIIEPFDIGKTRLFKPVLNNARIIAQSGWFTVHYYSKKDAQFVPLEKIKALNGRVSRIRIPAAAKVDIIKRLSNYGVRSSTVYPDIIGLCKHLNWKYKDYLK